MGRVLFLLISLTLLSSCIVPVNPEAIVPPGPRPPEGINISLTPWSGINTEVNKITIIKGESRTIGISNASAFQGAAFTWLLDDEAVPGATNPTLTINTNAAPFDIYPSTTANVLYRVSLIVMSSAGVPYSGNIEVTVTR